MRCIHVSKTKKKIKFTLEQAMKTQRGVEVYVYSFFNLRARWGWVIIIPHHRCRKMKTKN
jgi:hypothetical protein